MLVTDENRECVRAFIRILVDLKIDKDISKFILSALRSESQMDELVAYIKENVNVTEEDLLNKAIDIAGIGVKIDYTKQSSDKCDDTELYLEYRQQLMGLLNSIQEEVGIEDPNMVLIAYSLNSIAKIIAFANWVQDKLHNGKLESTEQEIVRAAVHIDKGV